jgi:hypothetical protein
MLRTLLAALGLISIISSTVIACDLTLDQRFKLRKELCLRTAPGGPETGCLAKALQLAMMDGFARIALADRCKFTDGARELEASQLTVFAIFGGLVACVDPPANTAEIEKRAKMQVSRGLDEAPHGCPPELRAKVARRIPEYITSSRQSEQLLGVIATRIGLTVLPRR